VGREGLLLLLAVADLKALLVRVARLDRVGLELPELRVAPAGRAVPEDPVERRARRAAALEPRRRWWRLAGRPAG